MSTETLNRPEQAADCFDAAALLAELKGLRENVRVEGAALRSAWGPTAERSIYADIENLSHYLALRHTDLSNVQRRLQALGLSSLGRSEAKVVTALDAIIATLGRLGGAPAAPYPDPASMRAADRRIREARDALFGGGQDDPYSRIMVTLPTEAATDARLARDLMQAGMTCARINCAHDSPDLWREMIVNIRIAERELDSPCRILMDVAGPKTRVEEVVGGEKKRVKRGDTIVLAADIARAGKHGLTFTCSVPDIIDKLALGDQVWINDGRIGAQVAALSSDKAHLQVTAAREKGERLKPEKGVNFPGVDLGLPALAKADFAALDFIAENADLVGFSFVQTPADVAQLQERVRAARAGRAPLGIVLKIETPLAVANLPRLIAQAASENPTAVMIARGDLAVELGFERLSEMQEEMLWLCEAAHVPVVWATQVLDGLVKDGLPSRAETTDAAMAQRCECVMLNKGPYVVEGVVFLRHVLQRMDRHQAKKFARFGPLHSWR